MTPWIDFFLQQLVTGFAWCLAWTGTFGAVMGVVAIGRRLRGARG